MIKINPKEITRFEVINHAKNDRQIGRLLVMYRELKDFGELTFSLQDDGKTLKIFLDDISNDTRDNESI